jgi:nicotinamide phosphoribosyltransferase
MSFKMNPLFATDAYKIGHHSMTPTGTQYIYSNLTPRKSRVTGQNEVVVFGLQYFLQEYLIDRFNEEFFSRPLGKLIDEYQSTMDSYLGFGAVTTDHIAALHELGYLPLLIKSLPEGTLCPIKVPMLTIVNTHPDFPWLTNYLETIMSACLWQPCTSATTAYQFRKRFDRASEESGLDVSFNKFMGHDFSFRGMSSLESAMLSGAGHLTSFVGTDTIPAVKFIERYYPGNNGLIGASVFATEHSIACLLSDDFARKIVPTGESGENLLARGEIEHVRYLITEVYPKGIVSIVSDTWDFWSLITVGMRELRGDILARDGKVVSRPDSGDPVKIICGDRDAKIDSPEFKGAVECLWDIFGGSWTNKGYRMLDPHVGAIYGDSINLERQDQIINGLMKKGFAPETVLGIGSYSYQFVTRDTFGFAMKATWGQVNGEPREIYKDPKTDKGSEKKSAKGLLAVYLDDFGKMRLYDQCTRQQERGGMLTPVFEDGKILRTDSLADIRYRLHGDNF